MTPILITDAVALDDDALATLVTAATTIATPASGSNSFHFPRTKLPIIALHFVACPSSGIHRGPEGHSHSLRRRSGSQVCAYRCRADRGRAPTPRLATSKRLDRAIPQPHQTGGRDEHHHEEDDPDHRAEARPDEADRLEEVVQHHVDERAHHAPPEAIQAPD